jgi:eukaryotic-like serine/threonine-protein kinase
MAAIDQLIGYATDSLRFASLLGRGGMGAVYRGEQLRLARPVAIKVIKTDLAEDPGYRDRFTREAQVMGRLVHPHVVACHDFGPILGPDGQELLVMVMEFVSGECLGRLAGMKRLPVRDVLRWYAQSCEALAAAHALGIVHRDIKPDNIMITDAGVAKLTDFGLARAADSIQVTQTGAIVGSPAYMSPEAALGQDPLPASDVYGIGCSLFHTLAGRPPFHATSTLHVLQQHASSPPPLFSAARPDLSRLDTLMVRCLAKAPQDRPDPLQLSRELTMLAALLPDGALSAAPVSATQLPPSPPSRRITAPPPAVRTAPRRLLRLGAVVVGLLALLVVIGVNRRARLQAPPVMRENPSLGPAIQPEAVETPPPARPIRSGVLLYGSGMFGAELAPGHPDAPPGCPAPVGSAPRMVKSQLGMLRLRPPELPGLHLAMVLHPGPGENGVQLRVQGRTVILRPDAWQIVRIEVPLPVPELELQTVERQQFYCAMARWSADGPPAWEDFGLSASMLAEADSSALRNLLNRLPGHPTEPAFERTVMVARPGASAVLGGGLRESLATSFTGGTTVLVSETQDQREVVDQAIRNGTRWCLLQIDSSLVPVAGLRADNFCTTVEQCLAAGSLVIPVLAGQHAPRNRILWAAWRQQVHARLPGLPILDLADIEAFHQSNALPPPSDADLLAGFSGALCELRARIQVAMLRP